MKRFSNRKLEISYRRDCHTDVSEVNIKESFTHRPQLSVSRKRRHSTLQDNDEESDDHHDHAKRFLSESHYLLESKRPTPHDGPAGYPNILYKDLCPCTLQGHPCMHPAKCPYDAYSYCSLGPYREVSGISTYEQSCPV